MKKTFENEFYSKIIKNKDSEEYLEWLLNLEEEENV